MQTAIKLLGVPAALAGMAMSTYTGALLSATSTPLWAAAPRRIAALFGASAMASGAAALTIAKLHRSASDNTGQALDRALDDRPDKIYHDLAEAVRCLVLLRTELTARRRGRRQAGTVQCRSEHGHWRRISASWAPPRPLAQGTR